MRLTCIRTNSTTGVETEQIHKAELRKGSGDEWWLYLNPGVTGYESASVKNLLDETRYMKGWLACAGTPNSWDKLFVPEEEMEKLKDVLRLLPLNL